MTASLSVFSQRGEVLRELQGIAPAWRLACSSCNVQALQPALVVDLASCEEILTQGANAGTDAVIGYQAQKQFRKAESDSRYLKADCRLIWGPSPSQ